MKKIIIVLFVIFMTTDMFANNPKKDADFYGKITITQTTQNNNREENVEKTTYNFTSKTEMDNFDFNKLSNTFSGDCDLSITFEINADSVSGNIKLVKHNIDCDNIVQEAKKLYEKAETSVKKITS